MKKPPSKAMPTSRKPMPMTAQELARMDLKEPMSERMMETKAAKRGKKK